MSTHFLIRMVDEQGEIAAEMQDAVGLVDNVLAPRSEECHGLARYIDPYGRTSFNGMQCEALLAEIEAIPIDSLSADQSEVLSQLITLLKRAATELHGHLLFLGD